MNMQEPQQISSADEGEETLVTPRFDKEETSVAQRVVPLGAVRRVAAKRPRLLALVLVSALAGILVGGVGLYFYQSRSSASPALSATETLSAPVETIQPLPAPTAEISNVSQEQSVAPATSDSVKDVVMPREADSNKEGEREAASEKRKASDDEGESARTTTQGNKGDADDSADQSEQGRRGTAIDTQGPIPEDSSPAARRARRVEEGLRRAERTRERQRRRRDNAERSQGSIESIFEGRPR